MDSTTELKNITTQIRRDILVMLNKAGSGHTGGSLSLVEILVSLYFGGIVRYNPRFPKWPDRDRVVLSKGHGAPALYAVLAHAGFFDKKLLWTLRRVSSPLQGHPDATKLPGIEASTGSLGHGISQAVGMALAGKITNKSYRVFCIIGDGEMQEGLVYEAFMAASHYHLHNLTVIVDNNGLQIDGKCSDIMNIEPIDEKFRAFGFECRVVNGHSIPELTEALGYISPNHPTAVVAKTVKGMGVSFMENKINYHGVAPTDEELKRALKELN